MAFNKAAHLMRIQGRPYLPVSSRLVWFREVHADWSIETEIVTIDHEKQFAIFRATVRNEEGRVIATATKKEDVKGFGDYIEKAETGSVGRALGLCGFSTEGDPDMDDGKNGDATHIVDAPQASRGPVTTPSARFTDSGQPNSRLADSQTTDSRTTDSRAAYATRPAPPRPAANSGANTAANMEDDPFADQ